MIYDVDEVIEHFGTKGMKWGVRNNPQSNGFRFQSSGPTIDSNLHSSTKSAGKEVASLMSQRYGFQITDIKNLKTENPQEYNFGTVAYVKHTPGKSGGVVYVKPENIGPALKDSEIGGWMAKGTTNVRGLLTHESAHAMFHAEQSEKGVLRKKVVGGEAKARDKALIAAVKQSRKDGISSEMFLSKISGYAKASGTREEAEAEMFSQYHWATNPPNFVKVWGETLHQELGLNSTPFKEVVKHG